MHNSILSRTERLSMKGCTVFLACFILFVLLVGGKGQSAAQNTCRNIQEIPCDDGVQCIDRNHWCDGDYECSDKSDETYCKESRWFSLNGCTKKHFECAKARCIPIVARCDGFNDCGDNSDEENCIEETTERESSTTVTESTIGFGYPTTSMAPRISTSTSSIPTTVSEEYYNRRRGESSTEARNVYYPPHYYGENVNNGHAYRQNPNSYGTQDQIPRNIYNHGQSYPHPQNQNQIPRNTYNHGPNGPYPQNQNQIPRNTYNHGRSYPDRQNQDRRADTYDFPQPRSQYITSAPYRRSIGLRPDYDPHRRYQNSHVDRQHHLVIPPRTIRYPPTSRPSHSPNIKVKSPVLVPFYFAENYTEQFTYNYEENIERAKQWILEQRDDSDSWGKDTPRALIALSLITNSFSSNITENELMTKNLQTHLGIKILRNRTSTEKISPTRLAMYINALLATCQDPRNFLGIDLVEILESRKNYLENGQAFVNPLVYLTLCLTNKTDVRQDPPYLKYLLRPTFHDEVMKDIHILATTALACYLQQDVNNNDLRSTLADAVRNLMDETKSDGSFGNKYNTALAVQALVSLNLTFSWRPETTLDYIAQHQLQDGSFGDMMATYYSVLALSGRSLLHLRNTQCDPVDTTEESPVRDIPGPRKRIFYSLRIGYPDTNSMSIQLSLPIDANFFDAMRIAEEMDPRFKFNYKITNGKLGVYSISNIQNDAERGRFWNLYYLRNSSDTVDLNQRYTGDIRELIPRESDELLFWYLPMF